MPIVKNRWAVHTAAKRKGLPMDRHVSCVSRRQFLVSTGAASAALLVGCGRLPWQGQAPVKLPRVGILLPYIADDAPSLTMLGALRAGLHELGYQEGQNIDLEYRFSG